MHKKSITADYADFSDNRPASARGCGARRGKRAAEDGGTTELRDSIANAQIRSTESICHSSAFEPEI
jgi:hypothetical protein